MQKENINIETSESIRNSKNGRLNRTSYDNDRSISNKIRNSKISHRLKPLHNQEDDALPIIRDEDFKENQTAKHVNKTEIRDSSVSKTDEPRSVIRDSKYRSNGNAIYNIRRERKSHRVQFNQQRLHSHQNRTKVRIQGRHGVKSEKYVDIQKSIQEQRFQDNQKQLVLKVKERHKIQERIEKYREEKIQVTN